jgi:hypothetical protein
MNLGVGEITLAIIDRGFVSLTSGNIRKDAERDIVKSKRHGKLSTQTILQSQSGRAC